MQGTILSSLFGLLHLISRLISSSCEDHSFPLAVRYLGLELHHTNLKRMLFDFTNSYGICFYFLRASII